MDPVRTHETTLLEREDALDSLGEALDEAVAGRGSVTLVAGEAGIGKTSLVRRFADVASGRVRVLWGGCEALFTPRPLGPVHDIAREAGDRLLDALADGHDRAALLSALLDELGTEPTLAVFEDVHWADEATLDALKYVGRRVERSSCLLVLTYRDDELGPQHPLRLLLGDLPSTTTTRIALAALSEGAVAELAARVERRAEGLHAITGGNPFFVTELLAFSAQTVPSTVRDAVLARMVGLPDDARAVLDLASVVPGRVELWLLDDALGPAAPAVDVCVETGLLVAEANALSFRHELARLAALDAVPPLERAALNRMVLEALESRPERKALLPRLAHHADAAGAVDAVLLYAAAAGAHATSVGAHREAAAQYARALRFAEAQPQAVRAELEERLAEALYYTERSDEAIAAIERALAAYIEIGDRLKEGAALCLLSRIRMRRDGVAPAMPAALAAVETLERLPAGPELAMAYGTLSRFCMNVEDAAGTIAWGNRALELAERDGDSERRIHVLTTIATMDYLLGAEAGRVGLEECLELAEQAALDVHVARAHVNLATAAGRQREYDVANASCDAGLRFCADRDLDLWRLELLAHRAYAQLEQGNWEEAVASAGQALEDPRSLGMPRAIALVTLGLVRLRRGDPDAQGPFDEAQVLAESSGELHRLAPVAAARAEAAWLRGDCDAVASATGSALSLAVERGAGWLVGQLLIWRYRAGLDNRAPAPVPEPYTLEITGRFEDAAALWRTLGCPYDAAMSLSQAQDAALLLRAHDELVALGARPAAQLIRRRLRERGVQGLARGPRPTTKTNAALLTRRELEVVRLLAQGLRNVEIADRLILSPRTVDHHVSAILRKLDSRTRGEAAAAAGQLGLLEDR